MFAIEIGVTVDGGTLIGASDVRAAREAKQLAKSERIYGIQFPHRVAALIGGSWTLTTPTAARKAGATMVSSFPGRR